MELGDDFVYLKNGVCKIAKYLQNFDYDFYQLSRVRGYLHHVESVRLNDAYWSDAERRGMQHKGESELQELIAHCHSMIGHYLSERNLASHRVDPQLSAAKFQIESILRLARSARAFELNPTKLQGHLVGLSLNRTNGVFGGLNPILPGQAYLHSIMEEAFEVLHSIEVQRDSEEERLFRKKSSSLEPVLTPIFSQLLLLKTELENFHGGDGDLALVRSRLCCIDDCRVNGWFGVDKEEYETHPERVRIPEGQAILMDLMQECYAIVSTNDERLQEACIHPDLLPILKEIQSALRSIKSGQVSRGQGRLNRVDDKRINGVFVPESETTLPSDPLPGQGALVDQLEIGYSTARRMSLKQH